MPEFKQLMREEEFEINSKLGYIYIHLNRPYYFPGQTVRGYVILDLFNPIPKKKLMLSVAGKERPGKHALKITKELFSKHNKN